MTEAIIKEELALHIFSGLAARAAYLVSRPRIDSGTDLIIDRHVKLPFRNNFTEGGRMLCFQLKTTTEKQVAEKDGKLAYDLRAKNFDDLIFRKNAWLAYPKDISPLMLILLVLPNDPAQWLQVNWTSRTCTLNGLFYWYFPDELAAYSDNSDEQRIFIPLDNLVGLDFFDLAFNLFHKS